MNKLTGYFAKCPLLYLRFVFSVQKLTPALKFSGYGTTVDALDAFTMDLLHHPSRSKQRQSFDINAISTRYFMDTENVPKKITDMTVTEIDNIVLNYMKKNKEKKLLEFLTECQEASRNISDITLRKLFRNYSIVGRPDIIKILQTYCLKEFPILYEKNGDFQHYLAKAQCMKGNSEKGLSILTECYSKHIEMRNFYRFIFKELLQDSVMNRSEASMVTFKKYVLEFSTKFEEHYPLVSFWHLCWSSSWFSDQMLSSDLLEISVTLQNIVKERATAFSINILREEYNEDAVVRLLQMLLKYKMMEEYTKVLQVLFSYKLRNRDVRGCTEIIRNCEVLGVSLSDQQQGRYIRMVIGVSPTDRLPPSKPTLKNFKLKF